MPVNVSSLDDAWGTVTDKEGDSVFENTPNRVNNSVEPNNKEQLTQSTDVNVRGRSQIAKQQPSASHFMHENARLGNQVTQTSHVDETYTTAVPTYHQNETLQNTNNNYYASQMAMMPPRQKLPNAQHFQPSPFENPQIVQGMTQNPQQNTVIQQPFYYEITDETYANDGGVANNITDDVELIDKDTLQKDLDNLKQLSEQTHTYFQELKSAIDSLSSTQTSSEEMIHEAMNNAVTPLMNTGTDPVDTKDKPWHIACVAVIIVLLVVVIFIGGLQLYKTNKLMTRIVATL